MTKKARNKVAGLPNNTPAMTYFILGILPSTLRVCANPAQLINVPDVFVTCCTMQKYFITGTPKQKGHPKTGGLSDFIIPRR